MKPIKLWVLCLAACGYQQLVGADIEYLPQEKKNELIRAISGPWEEVNRWSIEYNAFYEKEKAEGAFVHRKMAIAYPGSVYHLGAHSIGYDWRDDPLAQAIYINAGEATHSRPSRRTFSVRRMPRGQMIGGTLPMESVLDFIPVIPLLDYSFPDDPRTRVPREILRALLADTCRLEKQREEVNGESCVVFNIVHRDRLWIATRMGLCIMRRETIEAGRPLVRIDTEQCLEVGKDLWIPSRVVMWRRTEKTGGELERISVLEVSRFRFNSQVRNSEFEFQPRPGALMADADRTLRQVSPGGYDILDESVMFLRGGTDHALGKYRERMATNYGGLVLVGAVIYCVGKWFLCRRALISGGIERRSNRKL